MENIKVIPHWDFLVHIGLVYTVHGGCVAHRGFWADEGTELIGLVYMEDTGPS